MMCDHDFWRPASRVAAAVPLVLTLLAPHAAAQSGGFSHALELYLMGPTMSGSVGVGQLESEIDIPSAAIFENLEFAALADYRGQSEKWAVLADVVVMNLGASGTGVGGAIAADVDVDEHIAELAGAYRISSTFEVLAGLRYTDLQTTVALTAPGSEGDAEVSEGWFDPIVGAQAFVPLAKTLQLHLRGDIGGFGVGCDFTWGATARVNWQATPSVRLGVGYRWLDQDYETGSGSDAFAWNILIQGPLVAAGVTF